MVAILEPFIDTIIICTLTGLVLLSSGVWAEKHQNLFQRADLVVLSGQYDEDVPEQRDELFRYLNPGNNSGVTLFSGPLNVVDGVVQGDVTLLHARSIAEDVLVTNLSDNSPFSGDLQIENGRAFGVNSNIVFEGKSLVHSAPLTTIAFGRGLLGESGRFIIPISLLLFAFSTAIAWSYYGDRAVTYLFGLKWVTVYRVVYVLGFFSATIADTSLIWLISAVTLALMTIPNLIGIMLMRKEMKSLTSEYWLKMKEREPN